MATDRNDRRGTGSGGGKSKGKKSDSLSIKVVLGPCRLSFPYFFEPQETDNGDRYQGNFLFPPNWKKQPDYKKFIDALYDVTEDEFGPEDDWPQSKQNRWPYEVVRKAEEKDYEGYKDGWWFIKAASRDPIGIVDADRNEVTNPREVYGGRWARISVTVKAYDNKSRGVGVYLNSVQLLDHDEQFGGRGPAKNDFDDWEGDSLSTDDRGTGRGHARERDDDDRGRDRPRSDRARTDRDSPRRARDEPDDRRRGRDDEDRRPARGREDDDRPAARARAPRGRDDDRGRADGARSGREETRTTRREDEPPRRSRTRDDEDSRGRGRDRDDDRDPPPRRSRRDDDDDDRPRRSSRDDRDDERDWN